MAAMAAHQASAAAHQNIGIKARRMASNDIRHQHRRRRMAKIRENK